MKNTLLVLAVIVGILLIIVGIVYATHTANALPTYFPGYDTTVTTVHVKHSIAAFVLGILCFIYAWFQSGPKKTDATDSVSAE